MTRFMYVAGRASGRTIGDPGTGYSAASGQWEVSTAEDDAVLIIRGAYVASGLHCRVANNSFTSASSYHSRINAVSGNLDVTIPATSNGVFEDTTNSDVLADGDLFNFEQVLNGMHGNTIDWLGSMVMMENTIDQRCQTMCFSAGEIKGSGATTFMATGGDPVDQSLSEAFSRWSFQGFAGELTNITLEVFQNEIDNASTFTLRINAVDGNNQVTIPANSTGRFEDTTNSDSAAGTGEDFNFEFTSGADAMGDNMDYAMASILWDVGGGRPWISHGNPGQAFFPFGTTSYMALEGSTDRAENGSTTESDAQVPARFDLIARNLYVRVTVSGLNAASDVTFRVNSADSALAIVIPSTSVGEFEDTTDEILVLEGDDMDWEFDMSAATSGAAIRCLPYEVEQIQQDGPEVIHFRSFTGLSVP